MDFTKAMMAAQAKGYIAPFKAVEAIDKGLSYDIDADLKREAELFADCAVSDVAKNLIGIFLNTRAAGRLPRIEGIKPAKIRKVAMLGGGVMGSGIVSLLLKGGFETVLWDINDGVLEKGVGSVRKTFDYPIKKRKMKPADLEDMLEKLLVPTTSLEDLKDVDLIIEAFWKICRSNRTSGKSSRVFADRMWFLPPTLRPCRLPRWHLFWMIPAA